MKPPYLNYSDSENFENGNNKDVSDEPKVKKRRIASPKKAKTDTPNVAKNNISHRSPAPFKSNPSQIYKWLDSSSSDDDDDKIEAESSPQIIASLRPPLINGPTKSSTSITSKPSSSNEDEEEIITIPKTPYPLINFKSFNILEASVASLPPQQNINQISPSHFTLASSPSFTSIGNEKNHVSDLYLSPTPQPPSLNISPSNNNDVPTSRKDAPNALDRSNYFKPLINSTIINGEIRNEREIYAKFYEDIKKLKLEEINQAVMDNIRNGIGDILFQSDNLSVLNRDTAKKCEELKMELQNEQNSHRNSTNALEISHKKLAELNENNKNLENKLRDETCKYNNREIIKNSEQQDLRDFKEKNEMIFLENEKLQKENKSLMDSAKKHEINLQCLNKKLNAFETDRNREFQNRMEAERKLEDESKKVVKYLADKNEANKKSQQLEGEVENLKKLLEKKEEQMNKMESECKNLNNKIKNQQSDCLQAKSEAIEAEHRATAAERELIKFKELMEKTTQQLIKEKEALESMSAEVNRKQQVLNNLFCETQRQNISKKKKVVPQEQAAIIHTLPNAVPSDDQNVEPNPPSNNSTPSSSTFSPAQPTRPLPLLQHPCPIQPQQLRQAYPGGQRAQVRPQHIPPQQLPRAPGLSIRPQNADPSNNQRLFFIRNTSNSSPSSSSSTPAQPINPTSNPIMQEQELYQNYQVGQQSHISPLSPQLTLALARQQLSVRGLPNRPENPVQNARLQQLNTIQQIQQQNADVCCIQNNLNHLIERMPPNYFVNAQESFQQYYDSLESNFRRQLFGAVSNLVTINVVSHSHPFINWLINYIRFGDITNNQAENNQNATITPSMPIRPQQPRVRPQPQVIQRQPLRMMGPIPQQLPVRPPMRPPMRPQPQVIERPLGIVDPIRHQPSAIPHPRVVNPVIRSILKRRSRSIAPAFSPNLHRGQTYSIQPRPPPPPSSNANLTPINQPNISSALSSTPLLVQHQRRNQRSRSTLNQAQINRQSSSVSSSTIQVIDLENEQTEKASNQANSPNISSASNLINQQRSPQSRTEIVRPLEPIDELINLGQNQPNQILPNNHEFGVPNITAAMYELNPTTLSATLRNLV